MADKLSKSEFKKSLKEYAAQFKLQIESMNDGFDISPAACQAGANGLLTTLSSSAAPTSRTISGRRKTKKRGKCAT